MPFWENNLVEYIFFKFWNKVENVQPMCNSERQMAELNPNKRKHIPQRFPPTLIWALYKSLLEFHHAICC